MVVKLEELGLISRESGVARSARVAIPEEEIPTPDCCEKIEVSGIGTVNPLRKHGILRWSRT